MDKTWIVVADGSRARIFYARSPMKPLEEVTALSFPEGRMHEKDLVTDRPGRTHESSTDARSAMEAPDIRDHQHHVFARDICSHLDKGRNEQAYQSLILIAPPALLGALREVMNGQLGKLVSRTIQKNLVTEEAEKIHGYVFD